MKSTQRTAITLVLAAIANIGAAQAAPEQAFTSSWDSLKKYQCPEWFRDAKFGIWAHWGPQCVPMSGDWYARRMYEPGHADYKHHLENYGHPSEHGFKDIIPLWKAEKWDPERLMGLYKDAGAKYFVSMGVHHDNFDLWESKHHPWNAVKKGPKRDVVGEWQKAAKKAGLKFGVSEHLGASYTWWASSKRADTTGPKAGVPYDGTNPEFAALYHPAPAPGDKAWYSTNPEWHAAWSKRIHDLVESYQPDLLYSDGGLPFGETGRQLLADYYNANMAKNGGKLEAVYNCKSHHGNTENNQFVAESCVHDMERGVLEGIQPLPWQTDTSIGDWFYNKSWKYQPVSWTIHMLVDIVSKNGNLLLNVVQRPDGSLDPEVEQALVDLAAWTKIHGEAIYGTRPWLIFGEGPVMAKGGPFKEKFDYSAKDIRFTTKGNSLYAIALGWPDDGKLVVRSLAQASTIESVTVLGSTAKPEWKLTPDGLEVTLPKEKISPHTAALRIEGSNLKPTKP